MFSRESRIAAACAARMERAGHVKSEWRASENNRRAKYYALTACGRKALCEESATWNRQVLRLPGSWKPEKTHLRGFAMRLLLT